MKYLYLILLVFILGFTACNDDDVPAAENEEEVIDQVILTFSPVSGGSDIVATALDPDGEGAADFTKTPINLSMSETYVLTLEINNVALGESISAEVKAEAEEHMFFYEFTSGLFSSPTGNGNVDNREDVVNYDTSENDSNGQPLGITTIWETSSTASAGTFRLLLKHQPNIKSASSTAQDGETDLDITFDISVN